MNEASNEGKHSTVSRKDGSGRISSTLLVTPSGQEPPARDNSLKGNALAPGLKKNKTTESMSSRWSKFSARSTMRSTSHSAAGGPTSSTALKSSRMSVMSMISSALKDHNPLRLSPKGAPVSKHLSLRSADMDIAAYSDPLAEAETILHSAQMSRNPSPSSSYAGGLVQQVASVDAKRPCADAKAAVQRAQNSGSEEEAASSAIPRDMLGPSEAQDAKEEQFRAAGSKVYQQMRTWADREMNSQLSEMVFDPHFNNGRESTMQKGNNPTVNFDDLVSAKKRMDTQKEQQEARFLVKPGSKWLTVWRTTMVFVVLYAVLMAPLEIAFSWWTPPTVMIVMSYMVDILCILDMLMNFITGRIAHGRVVTNHWQIAISYLRTWFLVDFLTNFPWDKVMASDSGKSRKVVKILKLPKIVRLTRLLRVAREEAHTFGTFFTLAGLLLLAHYYSCLWVELLVDCGEDSAQNVCPPVLETYGIGLSVGMAILGGNDAWMRFSLERQGAAAGVNGFEWKSGFGIDLASVCTCLTGFCAMGMLFANIARAMDRQDSHSRKFNERLWRIKAAKNQYGMTHELYVRARKHFHFVWSCGSDASRALLEDHTLSPDLRRELSHSFYGDLLRKVPFLAMAEDHLVKQLCGYARMEVFSPHDKIIMAGECGTELFFLVSGAVQVQKPDDGELLRQLDEGSFFGEMALFNPESQRTVDVVGCSFGWLLVVSLVVLRELCSEDLMEAFRTVAVERNHFFPREQLAEQTIGAAIGEASEMITSSDFETLVANTYINSKIAGDYHRRGSGASGSSDPQYSSEDSYDIGVNGQSGHSIYLRRSQTDDGGGVEQDIRGSRPDSGAVVKTLSGKNKEVKWSETLSERGVPDRSSEILLLPNGISGQVAPQSEPESHTTNSKLNEKGESPRRSKEKGESPSESPRCVSEDDAPASVLPTQKAASSHCDRHQEVCSHGTCGLASHNLQSTLERLELKLDNLAKTMDRRLSRLEERVTGPTTGHPHGHHHHHHDHHHKPISARSSFEKHDGHGVHMHNLSAVNDQLRTGFRCYGSENKAAPALPSTSPVSKFQVPAGFRRHSAGGHHGHHAHHAHQGHHPVKPFHQGPLQVPKGGLPGAHHHGNAHHRQHQSPAPNSLLNSAQDPSASKLKEFLKEHDLEEAIPKDSEHPTKGCPDHPPPPAAEPVRLLPQPAAEQLGVNQEEKTFDSAKSCGSAFSDITEVAKVHERRCDLYGSDPLIRSEHGQTREGESISLPNAMNDEIR